MCKGRPQLSSRIRIRDKRTFLNKEMERVFSFFFTIEKEESKKWGKEKRRWVTVVGTEDWVAKCPTAFEEWWLPKFHLTPLAMWTAVSTHTFTEVHHSRTLLSSVSGSQWKLKERASQVLFGCCGMEQGQGGSCQMIPVKLRSLKQEMTLRIQVTWVIPLSSEGTIKFVHET